MTALEAAGYRIVFHVHDEVIADMPKGTGSLDEMKEIMAARCRGLQGCRCELLASRPAST